MLKDKLLNEIIIFLKKKILIIENELNILTEEKNDISKSSAGDKFETSRAIMQIEHDKLNNQLIQKNNQLKKIELLDRNKKYLISIGLGSITSNNQIIYLISFSSPIGKILLDKKKGDSFFFNNNTEKIIDII